MHSIFFIIFVINIFINAYIPIVTSETYIENEIISLNSDTLLSDSSPLNGTANSDDQRFDLFLFTQYCGPGEKIWKHFSYSLKNNTSTSKVSYADLDVCCKQHDECPNFISDSKDYEKYPGLPHKRQYFAKLQCQCDSKFYQCLFDLKSNYANAVAIGYGVLQSSCFEFEHPIVKCSKHSPFYAFRRCEEYIVDDTKEKQWQWFDVPLAFKRNLNFPIINNN